MGDPLLQLGVFFREPIAPGRLRAAIRRALGVADSELIELGVRPQGWSGAAYEVFPMSGSVSLRVDVSIPEAQSAPQSDVDLAMRLASATGEELVCSPPTEDEYATAGNAWLLVRPDGSIYRVTQVGDDEEGFYLDESSLTEWRSSC